MNRQGHTVALLASNKVLIAGGHTGSGGLLASAEVYDPGNGQWSSTASMEGVRGGGHTSTLLPDRKVLVAGGWGDSRDGVRNDVLASAELYEPGSGS